MSWWDSGTDDGLYGVQLVAWAAHNVPNGARVNLEAYSRMGAEPSRDDPDAAEFCFGILGTSITADTFAAMLRDPEGK